MDVEVLTVDGIEFGEVVDVGQENVDLDDLFQIRVGFDQDVLDVLDNLFGLISDGTFHRLIFRGVWDLTGNVDQVVDLDGLGV